MEATANWYNKALLKIFNKEISWLNDTIKVMLVGTAYTPDRAVHEFKSQVTNEITGTGYSAGGVALTSKTSSVDSLTGILTLDAADTVWINTTLNNFRYAVLYDDSHSSDALLGYLDLGVATSTLSQNLAIEWNAQGIFSVAIV